MNSNANERQVGGDHYQKSKDGEDRLMQHWDVAAIFSLDYFQGTSTKYIFRWRDKGGIVDLEKSGHYIQKYIEVEKLRAEGNLTVGILRQILSQLDKIDSAESSEQLAELTRNKDWQRDRDKYVLGHGMLRLPIKGQDNVERMMTNVTSVVLELSYHTGGLNISTVGQVPLAPISEHQDDSFKLDTSQVKCALCGEAYPAHTNTCTRRTKAITKYCSRCNMIDGHTPECPNSIQTRDHERHAGDDASDPTRAIADRQL